MQKKSIYISDETQRKMEQVRHIMSKILGNEKDMTWDVFFDTSMNICLSQINNSFERKFDFLKEESSKVDILRDDMRECFKRQNNQIEELLGVIIKQSDNAEVLQEIKSIRMQNETTLTRVESIQNFNASFNEDIRELTDAIRSLLADIKDTYASFVQKLESKVKRHFGIATSMILHHIIKNDNLLIKNVGADEAVKEVNKVVSEYKNFYNSSSQYSNDEIEQIIDRFAMTKHLKKE